MGTEGREPALNRTEAEENAMIAAPATPPGRAALAVVRTSGRGCCALVERLMRLEEGALAGGRMRRVGTLYGCGGPVDEVVALYWREGASYTGEEMVELCCHGSPSRVDGVMEALLAGGCRIAQRGEFTRRALLSGRMTPLEVAELAAIAGEQGTAAAMPMEDRAEEALELVGEALSAVEAEIEFEEEHSAGANAEGWICRLEESLMELAKRAAVAEGTTRVFIMGPPNSGKSSLLNRLAGREAAVVDGRPGTTRDGASVETDLGGVPVVLRDTAGAAGDGLDGQAYAIASRSLRPGDVLVWMEASAGPKVPEGLAERCARCIVVSSMADMYEGGARRLSLISGEGLRALREEIGAHISARTLAGSLTSMEESIRSARGALEIGYTAMAADDLREVEESLQALVDGRGATLSAAVERALERLCIGK